MRKFYEKSDIWFAVVCIIIYVVGVSVFDGISKNIGYPHLITIGFAIVLLLILLLFVHKNQLMEKLGLCGFKGDIKQFWFFIPLAAISLVNFRYGVDAEPSLTECTLVAVSRGLCGVLEEIIFRGLLFTAMCRSNVKSAIVVSSLTFGMGHIVNLLNGALTADTICQVIYACAIGFCFTVVFYVGKSIVPCIICHIIVNASSGFAHQPENYNEMLDNIIVTAFLVIVSVGYGAWLLYKNRDMLKKSEQ